MYHCKWIFVMFFRVLQSRMWMDMSSCRLGGDLLQESYAPLLLSAGDYTVDSGELDPADGGGGEGAGAGGGGHQVYLSFPRTFLFSFCSSHKSDQGWGKDQHGEDQGGPHGDDTVVRAGEGVVITAESW